MNTSFCLAIDCKSEQVKEELIASLSMLNVDGFEENGQQLNCYYRKERVDEQRLKSVLATYNYEFSSQIIESKNWNELWEKSFSPVVVDDFCAIRADFHPASFNTKYEIVITPKMSFGTGHHATTYLMVQQMAKLDLKGKQVADFGTGTGILSILAEKLLSTSVWAIDNDTWSIENAKENIQRNHCTRITLEATDSFKPLHKFDVIVANINKNTILQNVYGLIAGLELGGSILLSGLLKQDENDVLLSFPPNNFKHVSTVEREGWIAMLFVFNT